MKLSFKTFAVAIGSLTTIYFVKKNQSQKIDGLKQRIEVLSDHFQLLNHWLEVKNEGKSIATYFEEMGYYHIAIYGMAELADRKSVV